MKPLPASSKIAPALAAFGAGAALWVFAGMKLADPDNNRFEYRPNILAIQGSPLGKTLALAIQSDIDMAWHEGVSNPFEVHDHSNCDHDKGVCSHDHDHGDCDHDHGHCEHDHGPAAPSSTDPSDSWLRHQVDQMTATVYENNSPTGLTERHRRHIRENIERKVAFAYNLDPENYTNYNTLHLFYETTLGNDLKDASELIALAKKTRAKIREFTVDPEPWVTAASTQYNICDVLITHLGLEGNEEAFVTHLNDMRQCLIRFEYLRQEKMHNNTWEKIAAPRRDQMVERFLTMVQQHSGLHAIYEQHRGGNATLPEPQPALELANTPTH